MALAPIFTPNPFASPIPFLDGQAIVGNLGKMIFGEPKKKKKRKEPTRPTEKIEVLSPRGPVDLRLNSHLASHAEVERLRRETDDDIDDLEEDIAELRAQMAKYVSAQAAAPAPTTWTLPTGQVVHPGAPYAAAPVAAPNLFSNPLMMLALLGGGGAQGLFGNPLLLMALMGGGGAGGMAMSVGSIGGAPIAIDLAQVALMQMVMRSLTVAVNPPKVVADGT